MRNLSVFLLVFAVEIFYSQVGINTQTPEATLEVVGKPDNVNHFDGIIPPRITGSQLAAKTYTSSKRGAVVFVTMPPANLTGQVINVKNSGMYYFDGSLWQALSKDWQPVEYNILLQFDHNSTAALSAAGYWSSIVNQWGNTNAYLTASKTYNIGTKNFGGLKGSIIFRKIQGIVNIKFQIYRSYDSEPVTGDAFISIANVFNDIGYVPHQTVLLHPENSVLAIPVLLENGAVQISQAALNLMSTIYYTYGEATGFSNWIKPMLP